MIADVTEEDIDALVDVHFKGPLLLTQSLLPLLADGGSIVNLSTGLARFTARSSARAGSPPTSSPPGRWPPTSATASSATRRSSRSTWPR